MMSQAFVPASIPVPKKGLDHHFAGDFASLHCGLGFSKVSHDTSSMYRFMEDHGMRFSACENVI
jgi:hypothetical protein